MSRAAASHETLQLERPTHDGNRNEVSGDRRTTSHSQGPTEPRLVAESAGPEDPSPESSLGRSDGRIVQLCRGVQNPRPQGPEEGHRESDDDVAGLVASRL